MNASNRPNLQAGVLAPAADPSSERLGQHHLRVKVIERPIFEDIKIRNECI